MTTSNESSPSTSTAWSEPIDSSTLVRRHLALGWGGLVLFMLLGLSLETLHAFKSPLYLDADNETRRFLWRLAHAHGALLSLLQLGASWTFSWLSTQGRPFRGPLISRSLVLSLVLLPSGFLLAGLDAIDGDPGWGIVLVPAGAVFLLAASVLLFVATRAPAESRASKSAEEKNRARSKS